MGKIAADVVLLPSPEIIDVALQLNRQLLEATSSGFALNRSDCLPHISLAMGFLEEIEIPVLAKILQDIALPLGPISLPVSGIEVVGASGQEVSIISFERTAPVRSLHEIVTNRAAAYLSSEGTQETFFDPDHVRAASVNYVTRYREGASFERFFPHLTLGLGALDTKWLFPRTWVGAHLALCQLGNYCTCRKILFQTELRRRI